MFKKHADKGELKPDEEEKNNEARFEKTILSPQEQEIKVKIYKFIEPDDPGEISPTKERNIIKIIKPEELERSNLFQKNIIKEKIKSVISPRELQHLSPEEAGIKNTIIQIINPEELKHLSPEKEKACLTEILKIIVPEELERFNILQKNIFHQKIKRIISPKDIYHLTPEDEGLKETIIQIINPDELKFLSPDEEKKCLNEIKKVIVPEELEFFKPFTKKYCP